MLNSSTRVPVETTVGNAILAALNERFGEVRPLRGSDKLNATLGLSSLDLAFIVAELEISLGVDPFAKLLSITSVRTVDDLVRAYRMALGIETQAVRSDDGLATAAQRARNRRARRERR